MLVDVPWGVYFKIVWRSRELSLWLKLGPNYLTEVPSVLALFTLPVSLQYSSPWSVLCFISFCSHGHSVPLKVISLTVDQSPTLYLIRHGEKPPKLPNGDDANGLSTQGLERAQGLRKVFGDGSVYSIGCIIAEHPKKGSFCLSYRMTKS